MDDSFALAYVDLRLKLFEDLIMSQLTDKVDEVVRSADERFRVVTEAVAALRAEMEAIRASNPTPEDLAKLDALDAKIDAFDPTNPATLPPEDGGEIGEGPTA